MKAKVFLVLWMVTSSVFAQCKYVFINGKPVWQCDPTAGKNCRYVYQCGGTHSGCQYVWNGKKYVYQCGPSSGGSSCKYVWQCG
jgi:hypothetical protein